MMDPISFTGSTKKKILVIPLKPQGGIVRDRDRHREKVEVSGGDAYTQVNPSIMIKSA